VLNFLKSLPLIASIVNQLLELYRKVRLKASLAAIEKKRLEREKIINEMKKVKEEVPFNAELYKELLIKLSIANRV